MGVPANYFDHSSTQPQLVTNIPGSQQHNDTRRVVQKIRALRSLSSGQLLSSSWGKLGEEGQDLNKRNSEASKASKGCGPSVLVHLMSHWVEHRVEAQISTLRQVEVLTMLNRSTWRPITLDKWPLGAKRREKQTNKAIKQGRNHISEYSHWLNYFWSFYHTAGFTSCKFIIRCFHDLFELPRKAWYWTTHNGTVVPPPLSTKSIPAKMSCLGLSVVEGVTYQVMMIGYSGLLKFFFPKIFFKTKKFLDDFSHFVRNIKWSCS